MRLGAVGVGVTRLVVVGVSVERLFVRVGVARLRAGRSQSLLELSHKIRGHLDYLSILKEYKVVIMCGSEG